MHKRLHTMPHKESARILCSSANAGPPPFHHPDLVIIGRVPSRECPGPSKFGLPDLWCTGASGCVPIRWCATTVASTRISLENPGCSCDFGKPGFGGILVFSKLIRDFTFWYDLECPDIWTLYDIPGYMTYIPQTHAWHWRWNTPKYPLAPQGGQGPGPLPRCSSCPNVFETCTQSGFWQNVQLSKNQVVPPGFRKVDSKMPWLPHWFFLTRENHSFQKLRAPPGFLNQHGFLNSVFGVVVNIMWICTTTWMLHVLLINDALWMSLLISAMYVQGWNRGFQSSKDGTAMGLAQQGLSAVNYCIPQIAQVTAHRTYNGTVRNEFELCVDMIGLCGVFTRSVYGFHCNVCHQQWFYINLVRVSNGSWTSIPQQWFLVWRPTHTTWARVSPVSEWFGERVDEWTRESDSSEGASEFEQ